MGVSAYWRWIAAESARRAAVLVFRTERLGLAALIPGLVPLAALLIAYLFFGQYGRDEAEANLFWMFALLLTAAAIYPALFLFMLIVVPATEHQRLKQMISDDPAHRLVNLLKSQRHTQNFKTLSSAEIILGVSDRLVAGITPHHLIDRIAKLFGSPKVFASGLIEEWELHDLIERHLIPIQAPSMGGRLIFGTTYETLLRLKPLGKEVVLKLRGEIDNALKPSASCTPKAPTP